MQLVEGLLDDDVAIETTEVEGGEIAVVGRGVVGR